MDVKGVRNRMKYIRTKQGHLYEVKSTYLDYFNCTDKFGIMEGIQFHKSVVLKQADAIEELCDGFVIWYDEYGHETYQWFGSIQEGQNVIKAMNWKITTIYGAIWTDKGLIYVAKMNEKGELELL